MFRSEEDTRKLSYTARNKLKECLCISQCVGIHEVVWVNLYNAGAL